MSYQIKFTTIKSIFDNEIAESNCHDMTWERFCEIMSRFTISKNKNDVMLLSPVAYYSKEEALEVTDSGYTRRCADNVKYWYMLGIDIDGQTTIEKAQERFADYAYVLYTTFSHQSEEKPYDCFRIFMLLEEPVSNEDFVSRKEAIQDFIGERDKSTLASSRGFYIPSCPENSDHATFYCNEGKAIDLLSFEPTVQEIFVSVSNHEAPTEEFKQKILEQLGNLWEVDYDTWWKICSAMQDGGYALPEFEALSKTIRSHRKNNCKAQWNCSKRKPIPFGFLVNLVVEKFGSACLTSSSSKAKNKELDPLYILLQQTQSNLTSRKE